MKEYPIKPEVFFANKSTLDGYVFWRTFASIIIVKQGAPNKNIQLLLEFLSRK